MKYLVYIVLFNLFFCGNTSSQIPDNKLKTKLILYIGQFITWDNEANLDYFRIGVVGLDTVELSEFKSLALDYSIKSKPVRIISVDVDKLPENLQILFLDENASRKAGKIFNEINTRQILLITDRLEDIRFTMINFTGEKESNTTAFQLNKTNLDNRGFKYARELLAQGGSLIDVRELYRETSARLDEELIRLNKIQKQNQQYQIERELIEKQIAEFQEQIDSLNYLVVWKEQILMVVTDEISRNDRLLLSKTNEINSQYDRLKMLIDSVENQNNVLSNSRFFSHLLSDSIYTKKQQIAEQNVALVQKDKELRKISRNLLVLFAVVAFLVIAAIITFRAYRATRFLKINLERLVVERTKELEKHKNNLEELVNERTQEVKQLYIQLKDSHEELTVKNFSLENANKELNKTREEIEQLNTELLQSNRDLNAINDTLLQKTDELQGALVIINETKNQLIQSEKMASLGLLVAGIAHEINNPINFVTAGIQALQRLIENSRETVNEVEKTGSQESMSVHQFNKEKIEFVNELNIKSLRILENMIHGVNRINNIISSLSNYTRTESESFVLHDIKDSIKDTLVILHNKYKGHINIVENYGELSLLYCIPGRMGQLFMNLIANSIDAIRDKGEIVISARDNIKDSCIEISIKDTGVGIPAQYHKRIFDPFFTTKEVGKGTGLGLYIAFGIVEQHGGTIDLISDVDQGTEFIIKLPGRHRNSETKKNKGTEKISK